MSTLEQKILSDSLSEADDFASLIADSCFNGIVSWDREARVAIWNPAMEQMTGIGKSQAMGRAFTDVLPCLIESGADQDLYRVLKGETLVNREISYRVPETENHGAWSASLLPLWSETREISGGLAILRESAQSTKLTGDLKKVKPIQKNERFYKRAAYAWGGIQFAAHSEKSFRTHLLFALGAIVLALVLKVGAAWFAIFSLSIALVLSLELVNTGLENLADQLEPGFNPKIKTAKDCAAGAVLVASMASLVVLVCALLNRF